MTIQFTDDEIETIKELICDWGSDSPSTDNDKIKELEYKLGLAIRPTDEELVEEERKRKEFLETPFGKQMAELFKRSNEHMEKFAYENLKDNVFIQGSQWPVGTNLKIKLPKDYVVLNKTKE